ncbi:O-antigen translocase [Flavobacterium sp.]|uniref:O-antigen translocase n=1 Tax=Flavobacterium sp. TaxID=239 RepID=UPI0028BD1A97|nr:O-antigen translocase [Flavobacterium sp.]
MRFIPNIIKQPLFKITSLNSFSVMLKVAIGLITSKIIAIFVGPSGMALVGNLRNFISSVETLSVFGMQTGIVKYVAENKDDKDGLERLVSTVCITIISFSFVLSFVLFVWSSYWNYTILGGNENYGIIFKAFAIGLPWCAVNYIFIAIINGLGKYNKVIYISILSNILALLVSVLLIWNLQTLGALLAVVVSPSLLFIISYPFLKTELAIFNYLKLQWYDFKVLKKMSSYTLMALVSGILGPIVFLAIRNNVIKNLGEEQAGFWEAITRISTYYMMFVITLISLYFLPKLVVAKTHTRTKLIFKVYFRNILPVFGLVLIGLYFFRSSIVGLLFSSEFKPVEELFFWQFFGDFFKAASLIFGYQLLAQKKVKVFIITEMISFGTLFLSANYLIRIFGIEGVVVAHALTYIVYLTVLIFYFFKEK